MAEDIENLTGAWRYWVGEADFEQLEKLTDGLWLLYDLRGWYFATAALIGDLLEVLSSAPFTRERLLAQITLQTSLARVLMASKGYTPETEQAYQRALQLCEELGEVPQLLPVLRGLSTFYIYLTEFEKAKRIGEQLLSLAERFDDARARVEGHLLIGANEGMLTRLQSGIDHLEQGIAAYGAVPRDADRFPIGNDPGVVCHVVAGMLLWMSGFPDQACDRADDAIRLSERLRHPQSTAYAHFHTGLIHMWRREPASAGEHAQAVIDISEAHELPVWRAVGSCLRGAAVAATGSPDEGLALFEAAVDRYRALKTPPVFWPSLLQLHADVCRPGRTAGRGTRTRRRSARGDRGSGRTAIAVAGAVRAQGRSDARAFERRRGRGRGVARTRREERGPVAGADAPIASDAGTGPALARARQDRPRAGVVAGGLRAVHRRVRDGRSHGCQTAAR